MAKKPVTTKYDVLIAESARQAGIDPARFRAQLVQESGLDPEAVSPAGAIGIAQIVPKWWLGRHGLNTEDDIRNPAKAIPAAAQIMADAQKQHGSWNAALVAYNAGTGKNNKYINAINRGDLEALPKEARDYVMKLGTGEFNPVPTKGTVLKNAPQMPLPGTVGNNQVLPKVTEQAKTVDETAYESFGAGLYTSALGTAFRRDNPLDSLRPSTHIFSDSELAKLEGANIGESGIRFVMNNSRQASDVDELIRIAQENQRVAAMNRDTVSGLAYGVGEMVGDPITYGSLLIPGGLYTSGARLFSSSAARLSAGAAYAALEGAVTNVASESLREGTTGIAADYTSAAASGAIGGAVLHSAFKLAGKGLEAVNRGLTRVESSETASVLQAAGIPEARDITRLTPMDIDELTGQKWRQVVDSGPVAPPMALQDTPHAGFGRKPEAVLLRTPDGDTIHPASGVQFSSHNPLNPVHMEPVNPNADWFVSAEIGDVLAGSKDQDFKSLADGLVRSTKGYADGSSGRFGAVATDADKAMKPEHAAFQMKLEDIRDKAISSDPRYVGADLSYTEKRRVFNERVGRAISSGNLDTLSKFEREAAKERIARYKTLWEQQANPGARFGEDAPSLIRSEKFRDNYAGPIVYHDTKIVDLRTKLGDEGAQEAVARSFYRSYLEDADVKAAIDEELAVLAEAGETLTARELAERKAYGIVIGNDSTALRMATLNAALEGRELSLNALPDFRKARSRFRYDMEIDLPDGTKFSVDDLRSWDTDSIDTSYFNRVKGDVSIAVGLKQTPEEFQETLRLLDVKVAGDANLKAEQMAMKKVVGGLYGYGIRDYGARFGAVQGVLTNLAFMKSSAFMALSNYLEVSSGITRGGLGFIFRSIPGIGDVVTKLQKGAKSADLMRLAQNNVWGTAIDKAVLPTYAEAVEHSIRRLVDDSGMNATNRILGTISGGVQRASEGFWTARALRATTAKIVEQSRAEFFADIASAVHGVRKGSFFKEARLREASISKEQGDAIKSLLKEAVQFDAKGNLQSINSTMLANDPRAFHLRRYGQFWSEKVIQQHSIEATFRWSHLPGVNLLTQFMSFVTRSVNSRLIRGASDIIRNGNVEDAINLGLTTPLLGAIGYSSIAYLQSQKFTNEADRKQFLKERLGDGEDIGPLVAGSLKRTAVGSAPGWLYDTIGTQAWAQQAAPEVFEYAGFGKTSTEAKLKRDAQQQGGIIGGALGDVIEQAPAVKLADSIVGAAVGTAKVATAEGFEEEQRAAAALQRSIQGLMLNDPLSQRALKEIIEASEPFN